MATYPPHQTPTAPPQDDPFGDFESVPALSFKNAQIGTVYQGVVSKLPRLVQDLDFDTKKPKTWEDGSPQMAVVLHIDVTMADGSVETRSVWAKKPSSLYRAIGQAQKNAGAPIAIGGTLAIHLAGTQPSKRATINPHLNPQKLYEARYTPPVNADPWATPANTTGPAPVNQPMTSGSPAPVGWPSSAPAASATATATATPSQPIKPQW